MHRILAGLIVVLLAAAVATAIVKKDDEKAPLVLGTPTPTQTYTFNGPPPTVPTESETPVIPPSESASPTSTMKGLPNTGSTSAVAPALLMLVMALGGGILVRRTARGTP